MNRSAAADGNADVVLVTGAGGGIGRAIVAEWLAAGATVVATDLEAPDLAVGDAEGRLLELALDVTSAPAVEEVVVATLERHGRIDVLVNNAGVVSLAPLVDLRQRDWDRVLGVNARGTFLCSRAVARQMLERGAGGAIVNVASIAARVGFKFQSHYCAAKAAVLGFTRALALELAEHGIRVNAVCPGAVDTPMLDAALNASAALSGTSEEEYRRMVLDSIPQGCLQRPAEVARAVVFLGSPAAAAITGEAVNVDGGILRS